MLCGMMSFVRMLILSLFALAAGLLAAPLPLSAQQDRSLDRPSEPKASPARPAEPTPKAGQTPQSPSPQSKPGEPKSGDQKGAQSTPKTDGPKSDAPKGALPKGGQPGQSKAAGKKDMPGIAVAQPRTPAEREKALSDLYAHLATAADDGGAKTVAASIERLWLNSGSDTVGLLMERAMHAAQHKKPALALKLLDEVVVLAPDFAEGWNRRAYVHFSENNIEAALGDLRRVLALDGNHFKALDGLVHILKDIGQKKAALSAARKLLDVHPFWEGAKTIHDELAREVEGQSL